MLYFVWNWVSNECCLSKSFCVTLLLISLNQLLRGIFVLFLRCTQRFNQFILTKKSSKLITNCSTQFFQKSRLTTLLLVKLDGKEFIISCLKIIVVRLSYLSILDRHFYHLVILPTMNTIHLQLLAWPIMLQCKFRTH